MDTRELIDSDKDNEKKPEVTADQLKEESVTFADGNQQQQLQFTQRTHTKTTQGQDYNGHTAIDGHGE